MAALSTADLVRIGEQHAMNPASVVWPVWRDEPARAQQTRRARLREEPAVTILNAEAETAGLTRRPTGWLPVADEPAK